MDNQSSPYLLDPFSTPYVQFNPIQNPFILILLVFMLLFRLYHLLCLCYFVCNVYAPILGAKFRPACNVAFLIVVSLLISTSVVLVFLNNLSSLPGFCVMNVCTFTVHVVTLLQHNLSRIPVAFFITAASYVSKGANTLGCHYKSVVLQLFQMIRHISLKPYIWNSWWLWYWIT